MKESGVVFVIFGVTGDLARKKLIPAVYRLLQDKQLSHVHIIGIARGSLSSKKLVSKSKKFFPNAKASLVSKLERQTTFIQGDFTNEQTYASVKEKLRKLKKEGMHDQIFYLATGSNWFETISSSLKKHEIALKGDKHSRVVYEKPFGKNASSSKKLNNAIKKCFSEDQIYRIDHYLGKELVGAVSLLRFTNRFLEPLWNNKHIDHIQIVLDENFGIDERGPYYDTYGAVRDMVQNHMLQLLALLTMEMPSSLTGDTVRTAKAKLLSKVSITDSLLGQYQGYNQEKGISKNSMTETFAAHKLLINNNRWRGVPIFFRTGKFLHRKESKIVIFFKEVPCLFSGECNAKQNVLEIRIHPNEGIGLEFNIKQPGKNLVVPTSMDFCYDCIFGPNTPEGYQNLFMDIVLNDQTAFTRIDELQYAWKVVDKVKRKKLYKYKKGSQGPKEMKEFDTKHNIIWR